MGTWFYHPGSVIVHGLLWVLGPAEVHGLEHVPRSGPYLLAANHCSNLDPLLAGWAAGHLTGRVIHFMAKRELRAWPLIGYLASQAGVIFVRRGEGDRAAQRAAVGALGGGLPVALFPEGHRSRDGQLREAKAGAALLALRTGAPVLPAGIAGTHRIFAGGRFPHRTRMAIRFGEPFTLGHQPNGSLDRGMLNAGSERIMRAIADLLPPDQRGRWADRPGGASEDGPIPR